MLKITIPAIEQYDETLNEFITSKEQSLQLEHSLVSISKWESKWQKPFLTKEEKTYEETLDYIKCMTMNNVDDRIYSFINSEHVSQIREYIESPTTATTIRNPDKVTNKEIITSELIYYWMVALNIPFECQKWHLNRLLTLVNICNIKSTPPQKMGKKELLNRNKSLNALRKQQLNTKG